MFNPEKQTDSDSENEFREQFTELLGNYSRLWQTFQNTEKALEKLNEECNAVCASIGDLLVPTLCITWAMLQEKKQSHELLLMLEDIKSQMRDFYYSPDEYDNAIALCKSQAFADELRLAVDRINSPNNHSAFDQTDEIMRKKLQTRFAKSCPLSPDELTTLARTVDKENYQCFINPSNSIKNRWNNDIKWYRYCYAALELCRKENHVDAFKLYCWFGYARFQIGVLLNHTRDKVVFGRPRLDTLYGLGSVFYTQITNKPDSPYYDQFSFCSKALATFENIDDNDCIKHLSINIGEGNTKKTFQVTIILDPVTKVSLSKIYRTQFMGFPCIVIGHPPAIHIDTVFKKSIQPLYEQISASNNHELIYENLGKIIWYFYQLMPAEGGSSAINQMSLYDILNKCHLPLTPISGEISLDFLAIFEPDRDKFARDFRQLFNNQKILKCGC